MDKADLHQQVEDITARIAGHALDSTLQQWLNTEYGPGSAAFTQLQRTCEDGVAAGWLCQREAGGIRFGRVFKPEEALHGFSVDVVDMNDIAGPHHVHPNGEIDMIMPLDAGARFDGQGAGWLVYAAGSAHPPTVSGGRALVLYLLPGGAIEFSRTSEVATR